MVPRLYGDAPSPSTSTHAPFSREVAAIFCSHGRALVGELCRGTANFLDVLLWCAFGAAKVSREATLMCVVPATRSVLCVRFGACDVCAYVCALYFLVRQVVRSEIDFKKFLGVRRNQRNL